MSPQEYDSNRDKNEGQPVGATTGRTLNRIADLIVAAADADEKGQPEWADYWMYRAERAALQSGSLTVLWFVWRHNVGTQRRG